jgi:hypothetical protein
MLEKFEAAGGNWPVDLQINHEDRFKVPLLAKPIATRDLSKCLKGRSGLAIPEFSAR